MAEGTTTENRTMLDGQAVRRGDIVRAITIVDVALFTILDVRRVEVKPLPFGEVS